MQAVLALAVEIKIRSVRGAQSGDTMHETTFQSELEALINRYSQENGSNTPDFILAEYLAGCLMTFNAAVMARSKWYGGRDRIGWDSDLSTPAAPATE